MYEAGFLDKRITIQNRTENVRTDRGYKLGEYIDVLECWAHYTPNKGIVAMRERTEDAQDVAMFRTRYYDIVKSSSRVKYNGVIYKQISSPIILKQEDEIQLLCRAIVE